MKLAMLVVRDSVAGVYHAPFFVPNVGGAVRNFIDECNRAAEDNILYKHAADHELFQLGWFETDSAVFDVFERPESLMIGARTVSGGLKAVN